MSMFFAQWSPEERKPNTCIEGSRCQGFGAFAAYGIWASRISVLGFRFAVKSSATCSKTGPLKSAFRLQTGYVEGSGFTYIS